MGKFLVPVDGSDASGRALQHAMARTKAEAGSELHLVHAHEGPLMTVEIEAFLSEAEARELQRRHSEAILAPFVKMVQAEGLNCQTRILTGGVADAIAAFGDEGGFDEIIMGTRGLNAVGGLLLGSVATKVIHLTKLPVTVVK